MTDHVAATTASSGSRTDCRYSPNAGGYEPPEILEVPDTEIACARGNKAADEARQEREDLAIGC